MRVTIGVTAILMLFLCACNAGDSFTVSGVIEGAGSRPVELMYCPSGAARVVRTNAVDGKFMLTGEAQRPALAFLSVGSRQVAALIVENGDEIDCEIDLEKPLEATVKGSKANERLSKFVRTNAEALSEGNPAVVNPLVARFVRDNSGNYAATAAMLTLFQTPGYETAADSLMSIIAPEARPAAVLLNFTATLATQLSADTRSPVQSMTLLNSKDSVIHYNPYRQSATLLAFVGEDKAARDSIIPSLRRLNSDFPASRLAAVEISTAPDSAAWRRSVARDSAKWIQAWTPASVAAPSLRRLNVAHSPYFIIADSTGAQLLRTPSLGAADRFIRGYLK